MKLDLNRSIERKLAAYEKGQQALVEEILKQQRACKHAVVWELPYSSGLNTCRMCVTCRYVEDGSSGSGGSTWSRKHQDGKLSFRAVLSNVLFAPPITRNEFYAKRLPVTVPDYVELDFVEEARAEAAKFPFMACPRKSRPLDPLEGCSDCDGCGYHRSIPNPDFVPAGAVIAQAAA